MSVLVVAEKPSVARDIADVLGARARRKGYLEGGGYRVTWAVGHLVGLAQPHEIDPRWKRWRSDTLPMLPRRFPLVVLPGTEDQFEIVRALLNDDATSEIVAATDAGREGELIFRYIYERAGCRKPVRRLWISSLTPDAIRKGFARLEPASRYDGLAAAAVGRSRADWLVGMNLSRAYTLAYDDKLSVGRVQTPTLSMVVDRELAIRDFVAEPYVEVRATFEHPSGRYEGTWTRAAGSGELDAETTGPVGSRLPADGVEAAAIAERAATGEARIHSVRRRTRKQSPERLYDLTELQRHANRLYGFSAKKTLELAQVLYEKHKVLSYPRTDSRHLSSEVAATLPEVVRVVGTRYRGLLAPGTGEARLGPRFVDDSKVTDHHAIVPTPTPPKGFGAASDLGRIYDLVCRRLLAAWHPDHVDAVTTVCTEIRDAGADAGAPREVDLYLSRGTSVEQEGWRVLDPPSPRRAGQAVDPRLPAGLDRGQSVELVEARTVEKKTRPPRPFTEATLLTAMETAGRQLDDAALSEAMRGSGIGTPATRAAIIETLLAREYVRREGKSLRATEKGLHLIEVVHEQVKSPAMTGAWELRLRTMEKGEDTLEDFVRGIETYVAAVVAAVAAGRRAGRPTGRDAASRRSSSAVVEALRAGRDAVVADEALGALLPRLPGPVVCAVPDPTAARAWAADLRRMGHASEALHAELAREAARAVSRAYLEGRAPWVAVDVETLGVAGVPAMLQKRRPRVLLLSAAWVGRGAAEVPAVLRDTVAQLRPASVLLVRLAGEEDRAEAWARALGLRPST